METKSSEGERKKYRIRAVREIEVLVYADSIDDVHEVVDDGLWISDFNDGDEDDVDVFEDKSTEVPEFEVVGGKICEIPLPPPPFRQPEGSEWVEVDGRKWASDGSLLVRDDAPLPTGWVLPKVFWLRTLSDTAIRPVLATARSSANPKPLSQEVRAIIPEEYHSVLGGGECEYSYSVNFPLVTVIRNGELIAVIAVSKP